MDAWCASPAAQPRRPNPNPDPDPEPNPYSDPNPNHNPNPNPNPNPHTASTGPARLLHDSSTNPDTNPNPSPSPSPSPIPNQASGQGEEARPARAQVSRATLRRNTRVARERERGLYLSIYPSPGNANPPSFPFFPPCSNLLAEHVWSGTTLLRRPTSPGCTPRLRRAGATMPAAPSRALCLVRLRGGQLEVEPAAAAWLAGLRQPVAVVSSTGARAGQA
eukprot:scaffold48050_cov63-Phaeocystis_antarctica.AAC.3